jgi:excinuclease ABC subunit C
MKRASDHNARSRALSELQEVLELPEAPLRIECYDMAHLQGTDYVGSMVVMEDGLPNKREYRRFRIKDVEGNNDYAAMKEVLYRRLSAYIDERDDIAEDYSSRPKKFAYPPQLLLVDGGKGQLGVAIEVVNELGLADEIPIAAIAKKYEEIYVPGRSEPIRIPRGSESLFLLQRIRDEAHRFANTFHRESRSKRMVASSLEGIDGLGEVRAQRLLKEMGTVKAIRNASLEELSAISWLPQNVARNVYAHFHSEIASNETSHGKTASK